MQIFHSIPLQETQHVVETVEHVVMSCPRYDVLRFRCFCDLAAITKQPPLSSSFRFPFLLCSFPSTVINPHATQLMRIIGTFLSSVQRVRDMWPLLHLPHSPWSIGLAVGNVRASLLLDPIVLFQTQIHFTSHFFGMWSSCVLFLLLWSSSLHVLYGHCIIWCCYGVSLVLKSSLLVWLCLVGSSSWIMVLGLG